MVPCSLMTLPIDYDALRTTLIVATEAACELAQGKVIAAEPETADSPRPEKPYLTLKIITPGARFGSDAYVDTSEDGVYSMQGPRAMTVSFNCFGRSHEEAYGLMALLQARLGGDIRLQETLTRGGMAVWRPGAVADLSQLVNTAYEGRAQMDVTFGVTSVLPVDLGIIEQVQVVGPVDGTP